MAANVGRSFLIQHLHLGPSGNVRTATFSALSGTVEGGASGPQLGNLGQIFEQNGKFFRLVKFDNGSGNVAAIDGGVMYWSDKANYVVTSDASSGEALANGVAGGCHVVVTDGYYFFIQMGGDQAAVKTSTTTAIAGQMSGHASTDNALIPTAAGTASINKIVAIALSADGSRTSDEGATVTSSIKARWEFGALL